MRYLVLVVGATILWPAVAVAQIPPMPAINQLDQRVKDYITTNGSMIALQGTVDADQLVGRAIPCRQETDATYTLAPGSAYPLPGGERISAEAASLNSPLVLLAQGTISGQVGAAGITATGSMDQLSRLEVAETVRLSIDMSDDIGPLNARAVRFLQNLSGTAPSGYAHWCVVRNASVWRVTYETYDRRGIIFGVPEGLWIVTAQGSYQRNATTFVPYQVVSLGISAYPASWIQAQASSGAAPPPPPIAVAAISGVIAEESLVSGAELGEEIEQLMAAEDLLANEDIGAALGAQDIQIRLDELISNQRQVGY